MVCDGQRMHLVPSRRQRWRELAKLAWEVLVDEQDLHG
jgi:hypothetical protein